MKHFSEKIRWAVAVVTFYSLWLTPLRAQNNYAGSFLELGIGARAIALGGAFVAVADDGSSFYWNPAGVATLVQPEVFGMYASLYRSLSKHFHIGFTRPLSGRGAISLNWIRLTVPNVAQYDSENLIRYGPNGYENRLFESTQAETWQELQALGTVLTDPASGFSNFTNDAFIVTLAKLNKLDVDFGWQYFVLPVTMPIGINVKIIRQSLFQHSSSGIGFDLGWMLKFGIDDLLDDSRLGKISFGLAVKDIFNTKITWNTDSRHSDRIARSWYLGTSYLQPLAQYSSRLLFSYSYQKQFFGTSHHYSMEYVYFNRLAIRFGIDAGDFTAGVGMKVSLFQIDYAYKNHELGGSHRISTSIRL